MEFSNGYLEHEPLPDDTLAQPEAETPLVAFASSRDLILTLPSSKLPETAQDLVSETSLLGNIIVFEDSTTALAEQTKASIDGASFSAQEPATSSDLPLQRLTPRRFKRKRVLVALAVVFLLLIASGSLLATMLTQKIAADHVLTTATSQAQRKLTSTAISQAQAASSAAVQLTATAYTANATSTALANGSHPYGGTLIIDDSMHGPSSDFGWDTGKSSFGQCWFANGAYHVLGLCTAFNRSIIRHKPIPAKFAFEVQIVATQACGKVQFEPNFSAKDRIGFGVTFCQDGSYSMALFISKNVSVSISNLTSGVASSMHTGSGQTNTIGVVADGRNLTLYINYVPVNSVPDANSSPGSLALWGTGALYSSKRAEVVYHRARLWTL